MSRSKNRIAQTLVGRRASKISIRHKSPPRGIYEQNLIASFNNTVFVMKKRVTLANFYVIVDSFDIALTIVENAIICSK